MGSATIFAPQSTHTPRHGGFLQRAIAAISGWLPSQADQCDAAGLNNELRQDLGLAPRDLPKAPFSGWCP